MKILKKVKEDITYRVMFYMGITLLLFIVSYFIFQNIHTRKNNLTKRIQLQELTESVNAVLQTRKESYERVVFDYSVFTWMVHFMDKPNQIEAINTISHPDNIGFSFIQIYNLNGKLLYSDLAAPLTDTIEIPEVIIRKLYFTKKVSTFIKTQYGLVEIFGSTVHPSTDTKKELPPAGFVFFGKVWDSAYIENLNKVTNAKISIGSGETKLPENSDSTQIHLKNYRYQTIAYLNIHKEYPFFDDLKNLNRYLELFFLLFCIAMFATMYLTFNSFVIKPLKRISKTLKTERTDFLKPLLSRNDELGRVAGLIINFFDQRKALQDNIEQVNAAQQSMLELNIELSEQKAEFEEQNKKLNQLYEDLSIQNRETQATADHLAKANSEITDSIKYASFIQNAVLAPTHELMHHFSDHFIINRPKNIVSGDFYWFKTMKNGQCLLAVADCTGHGLSGSLLSMLGISFLNEITTQLEDELFTPADILGALRQYMISSLHQERSATNYMHDGMDIALCVFDPQMKAMQYSCAFHSIYIIRDNENGEPQLTEYKGNRMPVGMYRENEPFDTFCVDIQKGDQIFMFSDGAVDQFGGEQNKKFMPANLKALFLNVAKMPSSLQRDRISYALDEWKGNYEQTDDVMIMGIKI